MDQHKEGGGWPFHSYFEIYSTSQKKIFKYYLGLKKKPQPNNKSYKIKTSLNRASCFREWNDPEQLSIVQGFAEWTVSHHPASNKAIYSIGISIDLPGRELLPSNYFNLRCLISTLGSHISSTALSAFPAHSSATTGDPLISLKEVLGEMFNQEQSAQVIPSYLLLSMCL